MQNVREHGWEPGGALREALERMPLRPGPARDGHLARLGPLAEETLGEFGRLVERERGLSGGELARKEALGGLLAASRADGPDG